MIRTLLCWLLHWRFHEQFESDFVGRLIECKKCGRKFYRQRQ